MKKLILFFAICFSVVLNLNSQVVYRIYNDTMYINDQESYEFELHPDSADNIHAQHLGYAIGIGRNSGTNATNLNFISSEFLTFDPTITGKSDIVKTFKYGDLIDDSGTTSINRVYFDRVPDTNTTFVSNDFQYVGFIDDFKGKRCFGWLQIKRLKGFMHDQNRYIIKDIAFDTTGAYIQAGVINNPLYNCDYLDIDFSVKSLSCADNIGLVEAIGKNGMAPYSYSWSRNSISLSSQSAINYDTSGDYNVVVTDSKGCKESAIIRLDVPNYMSSQQMDPILNLGEFRPGFGDTSYFKIATTSCQFNSAVLNIEIPPLASFYNNELSSWKQDNDTLKIPMQNLHYDENSRMFWIVFTTSFAAQIGDVICFNAWTTYTDNLSNSTVRSTVSTFCALVVNGYDPNDISVVPGKCDDGYVIRNQALDYKIRFQNEGNAEAINIHILDTLDDDLDPSTLKVLGTSHPNLLVTSLHSDNVVKFDFKNINLIDRWTNEELSSGYIDFRISPKSQVQNKSTVRNRGGIFFDFNPVVLTNIVTSTFVDTIPMCEIMTSNVQLKGNAFSMYPNPSRGVFNIIINEKERLGVLKVFTFTGRLVEEHDINKIGISTIYSNLSPGTYLLELSNYVTNDRKILVIQ